MAAVMAVALVGASVAATIGARGRARAPVRGNRSSNTTCLMQVFFKSDEHVSMVIRDTRSSA